jgi:hypothetical protein
MNTVALPSSIPACAGRAPQVAARQQAAGSRPQAHATVRAVTAKEGRSVPECVTEQIRLKGLAWLPRFLAATGCPLLCARSATLRNTRHEADKPSNRLLFRQLTPQLFAFAFSFPSGCKPHLEAAPPPPPPPRLPSPRHSSLLPARA